MKCWVSFTADVTELLKKVLLRTLQSSELYPKSPEGHGDVSLVSTFSSPMMPSSVTLFQVSCFTVSEGFWLSPVQTGLRVGEELDSFEPSKHIKAEEIRCP